MKNLRNPSVEISAVDFGTDGPGSVPLTNGSGFTPAPDIFVSDFQDGNRKLFFYLKFFCLLLYETTFASFFKDKSHKEVTKQQESRFFLIFSKKKS
jgi:hypothetical protein